ncbi:MAG: hypothetical protein LC105_06340 [Chitinophagales bacterium]|nr:hypothetical protein [Chitinophagales bacterium]MCZ2393454.1 hypothetical protein [Chitinophagales bacterium]
MRVLAIYFFIFFTFFSSIDFAKATTIESDIISNHIQRFKQDSIALSEDNFNYLNEIQEWVKSSSYQSDIYFQLLNRYLTYIQVSTFKKYNSTVYDDVFFQALAILKAGHDKSIDMKSWVYQLLPDYYSAVKILLPAEISEEATLQMSKERPQELIAQFSKLDYCLDAKDLVAAILNSPNTFSQFMHYNNLVKTELSKSTHPDIKILFEIYKKYRYSQHPYYLLPYISKNQMSIEQAEQLSNNESTLINNILPLVINPPLIASTAIQQKWNDITFKYIKKIKQFKNSAPENWQMESFATIKDSSRIQALFVMYKMLSPSELDAFIKWIFSSNQKTALSENFLNSIPLKEIYAFQERITHDHLEQTWGILCGGDTLKTYLQKRRAELSPKQLDSINASLNISSNSTIKTSLPKPKAPAYFIKTYYFNLSDQEKILIKWKDAPFFALEKISEWIDEPYSNELLQYISKIYPLEIIRNLDKIKLKKQGIDALKNIGRIAPLTTKNYIIQPTHPWNYLFKNSQDSVIKTLYKINETAGINTRAYLLLDDIYHHKLSILKADSICQNNSQLTTRIIHLLANPNVMGRYSLEETISVSALKFVRNLNISENTDNYFNEQLSTLSPEELYTYITYGEDEIIQSSFNKMLKELINKSPQKNIFPLLKSLGFNNYKKFLRKCAYYDVLDTIFNAFTSTEKSQIIEMLMGGLENLSENDAIQVADIFISLNSPSIVQMLHQQLKLEYERVESQKLDKGVAIYGILSTLISPKIEDGWAKYAAEKYILPAVDVLPVYSLFNQQLTNVQQYYFYNDEDGIGSYNNFIRSYERSHIEWSIKDLGTFVLIQSKTGKKIDIFANKAREGEKGISDMTEYMKKNALDPQIVVHRGLSTHTIKTFSRIPASAKLILDGSCGGYHVQQIAIDRAPGAQILCNRNVGTMYINDPLFKQINDDIRSGKDIVWSDFWNKMNQRVGSNPYFKDYIPPHKNAGAILIRALYDILEIK